MLEEKTGEGEQGGGENRGKEKDEEKDKKEGHQDARIAGHVAKSAESLPYMKKALGWTPQDRVNQACCIRLYTPST